MQAIRKKIIQEALKHNIEDINTYGGYKGDLIVKISVKEKDVMMAIRRFCLDQGILEVVVKHNPNLLEYEVYAVTQDDHVYTLKMDEENVKKEGKHIDDIWSKTIFTEH